MASPGFDGYADVTDPRTRYDDLIEERSEALPGGESYAEARDMEAFRSGWVAAGVVVDETDRVLLVHESDADHWVLPGGTKRSQTDCVESSTRRPASTSCRFDRTPSSNTSFVTVIGGRGSPSG